MRKIFRQLFAFLASLQLAVCILVALAAVLAVGTFYESRYDTEAAQYFVYQTRWFLALLALLGINVLFAGLSRYPFKRHHLGFLVVHLGIILILIGSAVTLIKGYEGQVAFAEGESRDRLTLLEPTLFIFDSKAPGEEKLVRIPANFRFNPPSPKDPIGTKVFDKYIVKIDEYYQNAQVQTKVANSNPLENPAVEIKLEGSRAEVQDWLFAREPDQQQLSLGPASIALLEVPDEEAFKSLLKLPSFDGPLLWIEGQWISVKPNLGKTIDFKDFQIELQKLYPNAAVAQGGIINIDDRPLNPVVQFKVKSAQGEELRTLFMKYPDLSNFHENILEQNIGAKFVWIPEKFPQTNQMILAKTNDGGLYASSKRGGDWSPIQELTLGQSQVTGWMDFKLAVLQAFRHAETHKKYQAISWPKPKEGPPSAIHLAVSDGENVADAWLGLGENTDLTLGGNTIKVAYAPRNMPLGFEIKLNDFKMAVNPGTQDPASFESHVTYKNPNGQPQDTVIAMNRPLQSGLYRLFQASYQALPDGKHLSVLAVAYDPGIFWKYLGSLILVLGIILIFYFRSAYTKKKAS